jgi:hypothetical protein
MAMPIGTGLKEAWSFENTVGIDDSYDIVCFVLTVGQEQI